MAMEYRYETLYRSNAFTHRRGHQLGADSGR